MANKLPEEMIFRFLDTAGNGSGTKNANGNYSSAADEFYFEPTVDTFLHRMTVFISDTAGITQAEYGNIGSALTNGYEIKVIEGATERLVLTDGVAIKTNADLGRYCHDVTLKSWSATPVNEAILVRWSFDKAGVPLFLPVGYRLSITFNDDLSGLLEHYFMVQGYS